jgi:hypothetical protein
MKKFFVTCGGLLTAGSMFAYYGEPSYSTHDTGMSGFMTFLLVVMVVYIVISIIVLCRWWSMTTDVKRIREKLSPANPKLTYLVALGEKGQADKAALTMLVDLLYPIYYDSLNHSKAQAMNRELETRLPKMQCLGLSLPDYVTSGEKFIDYMNGITGNKVPYQA